MNQDSSRTSLSSSAILRIISFLLVLSLLLTAAFYLLNPGKWFLEGRIKDRNARHAQIMTIPQNCIDIYNIGNSLAMVGISPMELWSGQGYTSFNLCRGATTTVQSYFMLKHGFRYQDPDLVMIEASMLFKSDGLLTDLQDAAAEFFYYHFPFARYHNLWKAVGAPPSHREYYMGYLISEHIMPYTGDPDYLKPTDKRKEIEPVPGYFMDRILRLCQKKGKKVLIYSLCSPDCYDTARINALSDYAAAKGVDYIDLNRKWREIGIDWSHDTRDEGDHLNEYGVAKVTAYMGAYMKDRYALTDHRGDQAYSSWDDLRAAYDETKRKMEGKSYYMLDGDEIYD